MHAISAPALDLLCAADPGGSVPAHDHGAGDDTHDHPTQTHDCCHAFLAVPFTPPGVGPERPPIDGVALCAARPSHLTGALDRPPHPRLA